jgi:hypothetical protein
LEVRLEEQQARGGDVILTGNKKLIQSDAPISLPPCGLVDKFLIAG